MVHECGDVRDNGHASRSRKAAHDHDRVAREALVLGDAIAHELPRGHTTFTAGYDQVTRPARPPHRRGATTVVERYGFLRRYQP